MPDETGNQTAEVEDTSLHAYGDGREEDAQEGSRGVTGDQGQGNEDSYQDGGHPGGTEFGGTPSATGEQDAAGAHTGSGAGVADPGGNDNDAAAGDDDDVPAATDPESPARADASRPPRGAPIP